MRVGIAVLFEGGGIAGHQTLHFGSSFGITGTGVNPRQARDELAEQMAGDEAIRIVPAAHIATRRRHPSPLPVDLQDAVLIEVEIVRPHALVHRRDRALGQRHLRITEFSESKVILRPCRARGDSADGRTTQELSAGQHSTIIIRAGLQAPRRRRWAKIHSTARPMPTVIKLPGSGTESVVRVSHLDFETAAVRGEIKGIADGGEDACFAEARAGRREVVVTELQTLTRADTAERETPGHRQQTKSERAVGLVKTRERPQSIVGRVCQEHADDRGPQGVHTVLKMDCFFSLPSLWVSLEVSLMFTAAEASRSGFAPGGKELPTPKNRMVGAGTKMVPLDTWVTVELLVKVCVHVPEAK